MCCWRPVGGVSQGSGISLIRDQPVQLENETETMKGGAVCVSQRNCILRGESVCPSDSLYSLGVVLTGSLQSHSDNLIFCFN